jgi:hypothetical protein
VHNFCFYTTCRNRLDDLRRTLPINLSQLPADASLVVLDYGCESRSFDFVLPFVRDCVSVFRCEADRYFSAHAKNVAAVLASLGRPADAWLINLDADNVLSQEYLRALSAARRLHRAAWDSAKCPTGTKGRIAVAASDFLRLGGYNEQFVFGYGEDDIDLTARLRVAGVPWADIRTLPAWAIPTAYAVKAEAQVPGVTVEESIRRHKAITKSAIAAGRVVANDGRWAAAAVVDATLRPLRVQVVDGLVRCDALS